MDDPTTMAINLTFFGTLGVALIMSLILGFLVVVTLVLAGVGRLISIILLAMVGIYPKRSTVPIVHLPPRPRRVPVLPALSEEPTTAEADSPGAGPVIPERPRPGILATARLVWSAGWAAVRNFPWKSLVDPRTWPKPAQVKAGIAATATAVATSQAKEHPFVVAMKQDPPVLNSEWAAAVAEADARAEARAEEALAKTEATEEETAKKDRPGSSAKAAESKRSAGLLGDQHGHNMISAGRVKASAGAPPRA